MDEVGKGRLSFLRSLHTKKGREASGQTIIEGVRLVEEALAAKVAPALLLYTPRLLRFERGERLLQAARELGSAVYTVTEDTMAKAATTETPQGVLAVIPSPGVPAAGLLAQERPFLLAVDRLQDPGNLGTMLRTAAAAGATGVLLGHGTVEAANPKVLRSAMGATFRLPLAEEVDLPSALRELAARGVTVAAGDPEGDTPLFTAELRVPVVVVVGGEAEGLTDGVAAVVTHRVVIPMATGVESLNAAVAAGLLLYEVTRRLGFGATLSAGKSACYNRADN
ncbi:MAG: TrmH family RNA methyltransferase [Chitinophagales bacterium]